MNRKSLIIGIMLISCVMMVPSSLAAITVTPTALSTYYTVDDVLNITTNVSWDGNNATSVTLFYKTPSGSWATETNTSMTYDSVTDTWYKSITLSEIGDWQFYINATSNSTAVGAETSVFTATVYSAGVAGVRSTIPMFYIFVGFAIVMYFIAWALGVIDKFGDIKP